LTGLKFFKIIIKNTLKASILTGALLFIDSAILAQDSITYADTIQANDSLLLVTNDSNLVQAVQIDTNFIETDTAKLGAMIGNFKKKKYRSPVKAGLYSAIIPGLGQAYNHKYWKIPFIYAGFGVLGYYAVRLNDRYQYFQDLYNEDYFGQQQSLDLYKLNKDYFRRNRDRFVLFLGLLYAANVVDAIVDAYFSEFDISDDLSLKVQPTITYPEFAMGNLSYGMSIRFNFK
jgi:hypothetical protein